MSKPRKTNKSEIKQELKEDKANPNAISGNLKVDARPTYYEKVSKNEEKLIGLDKKAKIAQHEEKLKKPYIGQKNKQFTKKERDMLGNPDSEAPSEEAEDGELHNSKAPRDHDQTDSKEPEDRFCEGKKNKKVCN